MQLRESENEGPFNPRKAKKKQEGKPENSTHDRVHRVNGTQWFMRGGGGKKGGRSAN